MNPLQEAFTREHPAVEKLPAPDAAAIVAWVEATWWPSLGKRVGIDLAAAGIPDGGSGGVTTILSLLSGAASDEVVDVVRTYVEEAALALVAGDKLPAPDAEALPRLWVLRHITNHAAQVGHDTLRVAPAPAAVAIDWVLPAGVLEEDEPSENPHLVEARARLVDQPLPSDSVTTTPSAPDAAPLDQRASA